MEEECNVQRSKVICPRSPRKKKKAKLVLELMSQSHYKGTQGQLNHCSVRVSCSCGMWGQVLFVLKMYLYKDIDINIDDVSRYRYR